jgi:hypothetical protein
VTAIDSVALPPKVIVDGLLDGCEVKEAVWQEIVVMLLSAEPQLLLTRTK